MLKLEIILAENDVMKISEGLKEIGVGGLTVIKVRGRGAKTAAEIHTHKGMEVFVPHFADKYRLMVVIPEAKEEKTVDIIRKNSQEGKIFISQMLRAIDIKSGNIIEFTDEEIEKIQKRIAEKHGYKLVDSKLELYCVKK